MNALSLVSPNFFMLCATSYAGRPVKLEKNEQITYQKDISP
jgi:hypothetical protein